MEMEVEENQENAEITSRPVNLETGTKTREVEKLLFVLHLDRLGIFRQTGEILPLGVISPYVGENILSNVGRKCQCLPPCSL